MEGRENRPLTSIRGIAALYVVCFHLNNWTTRSGFVLPRVVFGFGYAAVDVFFILSGFIITSVYGGLRKPDILRFYTKRALRLYPLHLTLMTLLAVSVLVAGAMGVTMTTDVIHSWRAFPYVLLLIQPFTGLNDAGWNIPSWSIGVELLCYAVFPLAIAALRHFRRFGLMAFAAILGLGQAAFLINAFDTTTGVPAVTRGLLGFFFGVTLRLVVGCGSWKSGRYQASFLEVAAVAGVFATIAFGFANLTPLAAACLIILLSFERGIISDIFSTPILFLLGRISFSVYLTSHPIAQIVGKILPFRRISDLVPFAGTIYAVALLGVIVLASTLTYKWIEQPGRRLIGAHHAFLNWRRTRNARKHCDVDVFRQI